MRESDLETTFGATAVIAGIGVVTMALFPFLLPSLILLGLLAVPLVPVLLLAVLAIPFVVVARAVGRALAGRRGRPGAGSSRLAAQRTTNVRSASPTTSR